MSSSRNKGEDQVYGETRKLSSGHIELEVPVGCPSEDIWWPPTGSLLLQGHPMSLLLFDSEPYEDLLVWVQTINLVLSKPT